MENNSLSTESDADWFGIAQQFQPESSTTYLNHGSFGIPSRPVRQVRQSWLERMDENPMNYFVRDFESATLEARRRLALELSTAPTNLVPVTNATYGMNIVARSFRLEPGDQVIINDHEYGAVKRIWQRACREADAELVEVRFPFPFQTHDQITGPILQAITPKSRLIVLSHISSATATVFPVGVICAEARKRGVATCIDGPHAIIQQALNLDDLGCDFYTASCHKWLSAALGSGFLYVAPHQQDKIEPPILSWGRMQPNVPNTWDEEFLWRGTQDLTAFLTVPTAFDVVQQVGEIKLRERTHFLATSARAMLLELFDTPPPVPDTTEWYGSMALVQLPTGDWSQLQRALVDQFRIEVPIVRFSDRWFVRVSCYVLYDAARS